MSIRISYDRESVDFILDHYQELSAGIDPDSQCAESGGRSRSRYHAPGIALIEWASEIAARVKLCGLDGMLVEERYGLRSTPPAPEAEIAETRHIPLYEVSRRINRVKWFCVGKRRKPDYELWRAENRFHKILRLNGNLCAGNLTNRA